MARRPVESVPPPGGKATTRSHRFGVRTDRGVVYEALGDLWLKEGATSTNLTKSAAIETSPAYDPATHTLYYAAWTDDSLGGVYRIRRGGTREPLTGVPSQYGSLAISRKGVLAYVRGTGGLEHGLWLSNESTFDLIIRPESGVERRITGITGQPLEYANIAGKIRRLMAGAIANRNAGSANRSAPAS
jgi:hypothetical protein